MAFARIYHLTDPRTGEIRYVGMTVRSLSQRLSGHRREKGRHHKAMWVRQLAQLGMRPEITLIQEVPVQVWAEAEKYWIRFFRSIGCSLTNSTDGGEGNLGCIMSEKQRASVSAVHKGKTISPAHRALVSKAAKARWERWRDAGRLTSEATRARISQAKLGKPMSPEFGEGVRARFKGVPKSPEHREKIRQALTGKGKTPEHRAKTLKQYMGGGQ